eukprot:jgi/Mesvir1/27404/Mv07204-RA.1
MVIAVGQLAASLAPSFLTGEHVLQHRSGGSASVLRRQPTPRWHGLPLRVAMRSNPARRKPVPPLTASFQSSQEAGVCAQDACASVEMAPAELSSPEASNLGHAVCESVVIVGAGLSGLATAVALHQRGVRVKVFEQKQLRDKCTSSRCFSLYPNGLSALALIDPSLPDRLIRDAGAVVKMRTVQSWDGCVFSSQECFFEAAYGYPMMQCRCGMVERLFLDMLPPGTVHFGSRLTGVTQKPDFVEARFEGSAGRRSQQMYRADLLIGADGVNSVARSCILDRVDATLPRDMCRTAWRAIIPRPPSVPGSSIAFPPNEIRISLGGVDGSFCYVTDVGRDELYWIAMSMTPTRHTSKGFMGNGASLNEALGDGAVGKEVGSDEATDNEGPGQPGQRPSKPVAQGQRQGSPYQRALEQFGEWRDMRVLLEMTRPDQVVEEALAIMPALESWHSQRAIVIGDAAHATTPALGLGANMAFEDAWELAQVLAPAPVRPCDGDISKDTAPPMMSSSSWTIATPAAATATAAATTTTGEEGSGSDCDTELALDPLERSLREFERRRMPRVRRLMKQGVQTIRGAHPGDARLSQQRACSSGERAPSGEASTVPASLGSSSVGGSAGGGSSQGMRDGEDEEMESLRLEEELLRFPTRAHSSMAPKASAAGMLAGSARAGEIPGNGGNTGLKSAGRGQGRSSSFSPPRPTRAQTMSAPEVSESLYSEAAEEFSPFMLPSLCVFPTLPEEDYADQ